MAPALVVERGAKIFAEGTSDAPITFTSVLSTDEMLDLRGNWGGLIILGNAPISTDGGQNFVEGIEGIPYGGTDPDDDSGILRYVRVWHGGRSIGQDNEINGITLAGVGRGTTVDHCEVAWNLDDGFEMFGGTVDLTYCSAINVGDDAFDTDEGYQGRGQFLYVHKDADGDRCMEMDNKTNGDLNSQPRSHPQFSNMTCQGGNGSSDMAKLREGTGGDHRNLILVDGAGDGIENEDNGTEVVTQDWSEAQSAGYPDYLYISPNTLMYNVSDPWQDAAVESFVNQDGDPGLSSGDMVDVTPNLTGPAYDMIDDVIADDFFVQVNYKGAFSAYDSENWLAGWSWLSENGMLNEDDSNCLGSGDVNMDTNLDVLDVVAVVSHILGTNELYNESLCEADINFDSNVDVLDVVQMVGSILGNRGREASSTTFTKTENGVSMASNGIVGAVQMTLSHDSDFSIELTDKAFVADYNTQGSTTTLIIVNPSEDVLFEANGDYNVEEVIAATTEGYISTDLNMPNAIALSSAYPNPFNPSTSFDLNISQAGNISVMIYNVNGQIVDVLHQGYKDAGVHSLSLIHI